MNKRNMRKKLSVYYVHHKSQQKQERQKLTHQICKSTYTYKQLLHQNIIIICTTMNNLVTTKG